MDIEDFVKDVLAQVTRAVNDNTEGGKTSYYVKYEDGISFDLAVTTAIKESDTKGAAGGMKVKVIGAEASTTKMSEQTEERSSRVQFKVHVHTSKK